MRIFVTGGAGFIGRHLVESLLQKEGQVTIFDDLSNSTEEGISHLVKNGAQFVKGDITDYSTLAKSLSGTDVVVHLAAKISVDESVVHPEVTTLVNVNGTVNLLKACVANKIQNVIAASSAGVYADSEEMPLSENSKTQASSPYGANTHPILDRPIERRGLEPDVPVGYRAEDLAARRDTVLEAARNALLEEVRR